MAETGKKVEVRYGAFACRVEGFDDPVEQLREVLSLMQRVIAETPALADERHALDDVQVARIGEALSRRRADDQAAPGIIVIRSGDRDDAAVEDAEILADADRPEHSGASPGQSPDDWPAGDTGPSLDSAADAPPIAGSRPAAPPNPDPAQADAGPHPSAAVYAAPAAAAAEAAFAASVAAGAAPPDEGDWQSPLGRGEPGDPATPAALFAAPAADVGEAGFADRFATAATPADSDDDAGDPDLPRADEAAEERVDIAEPNLDGPAGAASGGSEHPGVGRAEFGPPAADRHHGTPEGAEPERPEAAEAARSPGGPGEAWSPWAPVPGGAAGVGAPPHSPASGAGDRQDSTREIGAAPGPALSEPSPDHGDAADDTLPPINIFAPPPTDLPPAFRPEPEPRTEQTRSAPPVPPDRAEPDPAAADRKIVPDAPARLVLDRRHAQAPGDDEDTPDDANWRDAAEEPDDPAAEPHESAENRLAALITRYQRLLSAPADD